jgi:CDP-4-dehydro-6-deoxyglucose reductase, E3
MSATPGTTTERLLDVTRAAKLAGVTRLEIVRLVSEKLLPSTDGKIALQDLIRVFPELNHSRSSMVEVTAQIKDDAVLKATRNRPGYKYRDMETVLLEYRQLQDDLLYYQRVASEYKQILIELKPKLESLREKSEHKHLIQTIINWYVHKTKQMW